MLELLFFFICYLIIIYLFPLESSDLALFLIYICYGYDESLSRWGFYLVFQQLCFLLLTFSFSFYKGQPCPKKRFFHFFCTEAFLFLFGFFGYNDNYLREPFKLSILLSGACIIYISFKRRTKFELGVCSFVSFFCLSFGISISPPDAEALWGIPNGIFIFLSIHLWSLVGLIFFWGKLPQRKQPLVPLFFSFLFLILGYFPELSPLEKWIEGIDLLLCILCVFSLIEDEEEEKTARDHQRGPNHKE